jgi:hypothetical protein
VAPVPDDQLAEDLRLFGPACGTDLRGAQSAGPPSCKGYTPTSKTPCYRQATLTAIAGCKHEHVGPRSFCEGHVEDIRAGRMRCGECDELGHICILRLHKVTPIREDARA